MGDHLRRPSGVSAWRGLGRHRLPGRHVVLQIGRPTDARELGDIPDPEVARRSARLRAEARAEGGTTRAADLIEHLLS